MAVACEHKLRTSNQPIAMMPAGVQLVPALLHGLHACSVQQQQSGSQAAEITQSALELLLTPTRDASLASKVSGQALLH
jgi:hypothetical protein